MITEQQAEMELLIGTVETAFSALPKAFETVLDTANGTSLAKKTNMLEYSRGSSGNNMNISNQVTTAMQRTHPAVRNHAI